MAWLMTAAHRSSHQHLSKAWGAHECILLQVKELLTNGTGNLDEEAVRHTWPQALGLSDQRVARTILELAGKRKNDMLVQAVAHLRTKRFEDCIAALNNVISCNKVGMAAWQDCEATGLPCICKSLGWDCGM